MRSQRHDIAILLLCAVPVLAGAFLWLGWQSTGALPLLGPVQPPPAITIPQLPPYDRYVPGPVLDFAYNVRDHWPLFLVGSIISVVAFIMLSGIWVDAQAQRRQRMLELQRQEEAENASDAPWLQSDELTT